MLNIRRRWDADEHLCREKKAKDDIPQRGNNYTECYPVKAASFFFFATSVSLKKKKVSFRLLCQSYLFAHASAGVCFVLVYQFEATSKLPRMCIHV